MGQAIYSFVFSLSVSSMIVYVYVEHLLSVSKHDSKSMQILNRTNSKSNDFQKRTTLKNEQIKKQNLKYEKLQIKNVQNKHCSNFTKDQT
jgi:hypothetical protein